MKIVKILFFALCVFTSAAFGQDIPVDELPTATINENYLLTLDASAPLSEYYKVDISHLTFANENEAVKTMKRFLTANLVSNQVYYSEQYMIVKLHLEYLGETANITDVQHYLHNYLAKP
jgi:hypothetical protein